MRVALRQKGGELSFAAQGNKFRYANEVVIH